MRRGWLQIVGLLTAEITLCSSMTSAAFYECKEPTGNTVITDSPSQLSHCTLVSINSAPGQSPVPFAPSHDSEAAPAVNSDRVIPIEKPHSIAVPLQRIGSLFVVAIMVNSTRQARLIIDTGASHTVLSRSIASDAQLFSDRQPVQVTMQTVGGQVQGDMVPVDSLRVADVEVKDTWAAIYDLPDAPAGVEGLLGLNFLRQFEMTLDSTRNQLYLEKIP
jgi:clan AA aspartic protease (TIGR02281 family)